MSALPHRSTYPNSFPSSSLDLGKSAKNPDMVFQIDTVNLGERVSIMWSFEGMETQLFSLFRSLISFGKPFRLVVRIDRTAQIAFFEFPQEETEKITHYLDSLVGLITKEITFKRVLKEIIANKIRFQAEQVLLQKALFEGQ